MILKRFTVITQNENQQSEEQTNMLINLEHIVSIKPIKLTTNDREVIDGYWIRPVSYTHLTLPTTPYV